MQHPKKIACEMERMKQEMILLRKTNQNLEMRVHIVDKHRADLYQIYLNSLISYQRNIAYLNQLLIAEKMKGKEVDSKKYIEKKHICHICDYRTAIKSHMIKHFKSKRHIDIASLSH